ncbi:MAG: Calx-beta domain-containing protein, partial [Verrucomicrobiales bacterium]
MAEDQQLVRSVVQFATTRAIANEASGSLQLEVIRSANLTNELFIGFDIASGSAVANQDYTTPANWILQFARGETNKLIPISILDNQIPNDTRSFSVTLYVEDGEADIGAAGKVDVSIVDNERAGGVRSEFRPNAKYLVAVQDLILLDEGKIAASGTMDFGFGPEHSGMGVFDKDGALIMEHQSYQGPDAPLLTKRQLGGYFLFGQGAPDALFDMSNTGSSTFLRNNISGAIHDVVQLGLGEYLAGGRGYDRIQANPTNATALFVIDEAGYPLRTLLDGSNQVVRALHLDAQNRITYSLIQTNEDQSVSHSLRRMEANGETDQTFSVLTADGPITLLEPSRTGELWVAGEFTKLNETAHAGLAILLPNGNPDVAVNLPVVNGSIDAITFDHLNRVVIGGEFTQVAGTEVKNLARLLPTGQIDTSFVVDNGPNGPVHTVAVHRDNDLVVGGDFTLFDGMPSKGLIKLHSSFPTTSDTFVYLENSVFAGDERDGVVEALLIRSGNTEDAVSLQFELMDEAVTITNGVVAFAQNQTNQTIQLSFQNDEIVNPRSLRLIISSSLPNVVVTQSEAEIYVRDDERPGALNTDFPKNLHMTSVADIAAQSDGKLIVAGASNGIPNVLRLHPDGTLDPTFKLEIPSLNGFDSFFNYSFLALLVQSDDSILIGGDFMAHRFFTGTNYLIKVTKDGKYDPTFRAMFRGNSRVSHVSHLAPADNGSIWVAGVEVDYISAPPQTRHAVFRLKADGSLDNWPSLAGGIVFSTSSLVPLDDGGILVGGSYLGRSSILKITGHGTIDTNFTTHITRQVTAMVQDGNWIYISGLFTNVNEIRQPYLARINTNGSLDESFRPALNNTVHSFHVLPNHNLIIGGNFTSINGEPVGRIAMLKPDGTMDASFKTLPGADYHLNTITTREDGQLLVAGSFSTFDHSDYSGIALLHMPNSPGRIELQETSLTVSVNDSTVQIIVRRTGGSKGSLSASLTSRNISAIAGIDFTAVNQTVTYADGEFGQKVITIPLQPSSPEVKGNKTFAVDLVPLDGAVFAPARATVLIENLEEGGMDNSFAPVYTASKGFINEFNFQLDGKILLAGSFTNLNGLSLSNIARLNVNGTVDETFFPGAGANNQIHTIGADDAGRIVIAGQFDRYNGVSLRVGPATRRMARLHPNGSLDTSFAPNANFSSPMWRSLVYPDGKVLLYSPEFVRYLPDGSKDAAFASSRSQFDQAKLLSNEDIAAISLFSLSRISPTGAVLWAVGPPRDFRFSSVNEAADSDLIAAVSQTRPTAFSRSNLFRINLDGTYDASFNAGVFSLPNITNAVSLANNDILVAGSFTNVQDNTVHNLARLDSTGKLRPEFRYSFDGLLRLMKLDAAGRIYLVVAKTNASNQPYQELIRLNSARLAAPTATITLSPAIVVEGEPVNIRVDAFDPDGFIATTELFLDGEKIAAVEGGLVDYQISNLPAGEKVYRLTAVTTDTHGHTASAAPIEFTVGKQQTTPPEV